MKYRLLALAITTITLQVQAQRLSSTSIVRTETQVALQATERSELPQKDEPGIAQRSGWTNAKAASTAFYTQTFASLPAGWTIAANPGFVNGWRWANAAPTGTGNSFPINGLINSTTKSDGWLLYNADSVLNNRGGAALPFGGAITSAAIPVGATHPNVMLRFQQYYRHSDGDSCFVDVSSNGTNWTSFPVYPNMELSQFGFLYRNPTITTINISSVVGAQPNAYIRFRFNSTAAQYSFNWLIDDLMLYDADSTDLGITYSGIASASDRTNGFSTSYSYSSIPLRFADTVFPITYLSNYGLNATTNSTVTARYYLGGNLIATHTANAASAPAGARDSALVFGTGYRPTAAGDYVIALSINQPGDAATENNVDTIRFSVTDSVYASHGTEFTERNCYLSRPSNSTLQYWGARFTISNGRQDTITSVSAAFRPVTAAGERVQAQLYKASGSGTSFSWIPLTISETRTLSASDISTASNVVMTTFPMKVSGRNYTPLILGNGDYAIVLTTVNATNDVAVYSMVPPLPTAPDYIGYQGQSELSPNDGSAGFASTGGIATGVVQVPLVHPNFGNARALLAVPETEPIIVGAAFPNPANTKLNVPVALQQSGFAWLTLSNSIGQQVAYMDLGRLDGGVMQLVSVPTGHLPDGIYLYRVATELGQLTGRLVIKH